MVEAKKVYEKVVTHGVLDIVEVDTDALDKLMRELYGNREVLELEA